MIKFLLEEKRKDNKLENLTRTTEMGRVLLQAMVEQDRSEKRAESEFKKEAWVISVEQVKAIGKTPSLFDNKKKAKDKLDTLKTRWKIWWKLRQEVSEWGWNEITQLFEASPEQWERYTCWKCSYVMLAAYIVGPCSAEPDASAEVEAVHAEARNRTSEIESRADETEIEMS